MPEQQRMTANPSKDVALARSSGEAAPLDDGGNPLASKAR